MLDKNLSRTTFNTGELKIQLRSQTQPKHTATVKENVETQAVLLHIMTTLAHKHAFLVQPL